jgi:hypothetical protein
LAISSLSGETAADSRPSKSKGRVFIYDSLEIDQIEAAMDANFERIENMMYIRIHHPPKTEGGTPTVEDDHC